MSAALAAVWLFLKDNWKLALVVAALVAAWFWHTSRVDAARDELHDHYGAILNELAEKTKATDKLWRQAETALKNNQKEITRVAQQKIEAAESDAAAADAAAASLRDAARRRTNAAKAARRADPVAGGAAADAALDLLADMLSRPDEAAGELAKFADRAHIAGNTCVLEYNAVKAELDALRAAQPEQ